MSVVIDVLRAFWLDGARMEPGQRLAVGAGLAAELISAGKAMRAPGRPAPQPEPEVDPAEHEPVQAAPRSPSRRSTVTSKE